MNPSNPYYSYYLMRDSKFMKDDNTLKFGQYYPYDKDTDYNSLYGILSITHGGNMVEKGMSQKKAHKKVETLIYQVQKDSAKTYKNNYSPENIHPEFITDDLDNWLFFMMCQSYLRLSKDLSP